MVTSFETETTQSPPPAQAAASLPNEIDSHELLDESAWLELRDAGIEPLVQTELTTTLQARQEFLVGAWLLGIENSIKPQMLRVVDMLTTGRFRNGIIMPRRSSKTTTLFCVLLGRCYLRPVHLAGFTLLTTFKKAAERYRLDVYGPISRRWSNPETRPVKLFKGNGTERVEFPNGSVLAVLSPDGDAVRSGAYDTLLLDEGGEASATMGADILSAVIPSFDTRPDGQLIVAGTAAKYRDGNILHDTLTNERAGVIRYTVPDEVSDEELEAWEPTEEHPDGNVKELILAAHPGIGTLTTLDRIKENYETLTVEQFAREYLGLFGLEGISSGLIAPAKWEAAALDGKLPPPPETFALAIAAHPDSRCGSIVAAWKDEEGLSHLGVLEARAGVKWMASAALKWSRKYSVPIIYDAGSQAVLVEVEALQRARPRPRLEPKDFRAVRVAASKLVKLLDEGTLRHYHQDELDTAAALVVKRKAGAANGWALGRGAPDDDITALEAGSLALVAVEELKPKRKRKVQVVT